MDAIGGIMACSRWPSTGALLTRLLALAAAAATADSSTANPTGRVIVFFLSDDMGHADVGYNREVAGIDPDMHIPTPHLDALSARGVRLATYYAESLCSPSRAALLTGRYGFRSGIAGPLYTDSAGRIPTEYTTLAEALKTRGYRTALSGKWHVGHATNASLPTARGFDTALGNYDHAINYYTKTMTEFAGTVHDWHRADGGGGGGGGGARAGFVRADAGQAYATDAIVAEAVRVLEDHAAHHARRDLFLYVAFTAAHDPLEPPRCDAARGAGPERSCGAVRTHCAHIADPWRAKFCALVQGVDVGVGDVVAALGRLGLCDVAGHNRAGRGNCLVAFSSDNGGSTYSGGLNLPFAGQKVDALEGGVRVPAFVWGLRDASSLGPLGGT